MLVNRAALRLGATVLALTGVLAAAPAHAQAPLGGLAGHISYINPDDTTVPAPGSIVELCMKDPGNRQCWRVQVGAEGSYLQRELPPGQYTLTVHAGPTVNANPVRLETVTVTGGAIRDGLNFRLRIPTAPPAGTTVSGIGTDDRRLPVVFWGAPFTIRATGCPGGSATYTAENAVHPIPPGALTEGPAGVYTATLPAVHPSHGDTHFKVTIDCPSPTPDQTIGFDIYIDPSGFVRTVAGAPIAGATVTLLRSDSETAAGPFATVEDGSDVMSPSNRRNPDVTDAGGHFGWDVKEGYYVVRASKAGCVDPDDPTKAYVESHVMEIPPPVTDLDLRLDCPGEATSEDGNVLGTVPGVLSLTLGPAAHFGAFTPGVTRDYVASTSATVTSSAGDATLTIADASSAATGHLLNGQFVLPGPLQVRAPGRPFEPLGAGLAVSSWNGPVGSEHVTVEFRQPISAADALRRGTYGKTLTYTLSTDNP